MGRPFLLNDMNKQNYIYQYVHKEAYTSNLPDGYEMNA